MISTASLLVISLLAILVGASLPVLYQLYQLARRARAFLDTTGPRLDEALLQVGEASDRINGITSSIEAQARTLGPVLNAFTRSGRWLRTALAFSGALTPAALAGARALFSRLDDQAGKEAR